LPKRNKLVLAGLISLVILGDLFVLKSPGQESEGKFYVVEMWDFYFDPPGLRLEPGDRVAWIMLQDTLADGHSASAYHPGNDKVLRVPEGAGNWSTPLIIENGVWGEYIFQAIGVHDYFCIPHETEGMVGRVIVTEASGPGADETNHGISAAGQSSIPTISEIMGPGGLIFNAQARINAVVFYVREQSRPEARSAISDLIEEVKAGKDQEKSLYEALLEVDMAQEFLAGLDELSAALSPGHPLSEIADLAEELKILLDEAYQQIVTSGSGT